MRLRNIKGSRENIQASKYVVQEYREQKGKWRELFGNDHPIHIEIGMGKGRFLMDMATLHPEINYVGIEKYSSVLLRGIQKQEELQLPNVMFIRMEAEYITEVFAKDEVDRIYLNFSDPWPKDRHAKRRLTSSRYRDLYAALLPSGSPLEFKTDNSGLFEYSLEEFKADPNFELTVVTDDLHNDPVLSAGNIMTEYEEKFSSMGNPIHKLIAIRN